MTQAMNIHQQLILIFSAKLTIRGISLQAPLCKLIYVHQQSFHEDHCVDIFFLFCGVMKVTFNNL